MAERITLSLFEPVQAHKALMHAWVQAKALLMAGHCRGFAAADGCAQCRVSRVIAVTANSWGVA